MFQWIYDFFMIYLMPFILQICDFLGIDMSKKVHFEDDQKYSESDTASASAASASASAASASNSVIAASAATAMAVPQE